MYLLWETSNWPGSTIEPGISWLSWINSSNKTDVVDIDDTSEGYLACGSKSGSVGITLTDEHARTSCSTTAESTKRCNYNLRGHHSPVCRVEWNKHQQKLASCDQSGIIYVWARYEDRWSIELVNDRGTSVRDFSWSCDGMFALIVYMDNFVLVGSAAGQRVWSTLVENHAVVSGAWEPSSRRVVLGTTVGSLLLMSEDGNLLSEHQVLRPHWIEFIQFSCIRSSDKKSTLLLYFLGGMIYLMDSCDDPDPIIIQTELENARIQWTQNGEYFAVLGSKKDSSTETILLIYSKDGVRSYSDRIPGDGVLPRGGLTTPSCYLRGFSWGHDDRVIFASVGGLLNVARVFYETPSLKIFASLTVFRTINEQADLADDLPLPLNDKNMIKSHGSHIIECRIPNTRELCKNICRPSFCRFYCSIRPSTGQLGQAWELCCEHAGGLIPLLGACVTNKLRPEFEIWLGPSSSTKKESSPSSSNEMTIQRGGLQRDSVWRRSKRQLQAMVQRAQQTIHPPKIRKKLALVTSNVWCTRFKVVGLDSEYLPPYLGEVIYKPSVLHLQPRQMTVHLVDLHKGFTSGLAPMPPIVSDVEGSDTGADENLMAYIGEGPPVAPMASEIFTSNVHRITSEGASSSSSNNVESAYVDMSKIDFPFMAADDEGEMLKQLIDEFAELKNAADEHINRMRMFAQDLQMKSRNLHVQPPQPQLPPSIVAAERTCSFPNNKETKNNNNKDTWSSTTSRQSENNWWETVEEEFDFIDDDDSLVISNDVDKKRWKARSLSLVLLPERQESTSTTSGGDIRPNSATAVFKQMEPVAQCAAIRSGAMREVSTVLDKLCKLASDLAPRHGQLEASSSSHAMFSGGGSKVSPDQRSNPTALSMDNGQTTAYSQLFQQFNQVSRRVEQLENLLTYGSELLDEVRYDLLERVRRIRTFLDSAPATVLDADDRGKDQTKSCADAAAMPPSLKRRTLLGSVGEKSAQCSPSCSATGAATNSQSLASSTTSSGEILTLHNKTPFWNDTVQVYQLDFGGRVTQESAKNFQIEFRNKQVMQFGRIENGGYTLDFEAPFTAVQAFAVALASITQRFK